MKKEFLECGKILTAHGVRGAVKVEHFCDSARVLAKAKRVFFYERGEYKECQVLDGSVLGQFVLLTLSGMDSREEAIALRGVTIYFHRSDVPLPHGAVLLADMIGLPVIHAESGEVLGKISDVSDVAGRRIYTVKTDTGEVLLPDVPDFIKEISETGGMKVLPIPGFFDKADEV